MTLVAGICLAVGTVLGVAGWVVLLRAGRDIRWPLLFPRGGLDRPRTANLLTGSAVALVAVAFLSSEAGPTLPVLFWWSVMMFAVSTALQVRHRWGR